MDVFTGNAEHDFNKRHLTTEEVKEKVKEAIKDKSKFKEIIAKLKSTDPETIGNIKKYTDVNQDLRRNALSMANEIKIQKTVNDRLTLAQKKKFQAAQIQKKDMEKALANQLPGEIDSVYVACNGKISQTQSNIQQIEQEANWILYPIILGDNQFVMVVNSNILSGRNRLASDLLNETVCGPVRFIMIQQDIGAVPMVSKFFKSVLEVHNIQFK